MRTYKTHQSKAMLLLGLSMLMSGCADDPNSEGVPDEDISGGSAVNTAPEVSQVEVLATTDDDEDGDPATAVFSDTLECVWDYEDAEGNADKSTVVWSAGDTVLAEGSTFEDSTLSGSFNGGDTVTCTVTPDDGADAGVPMSGSIQIGILEPLVSNLELMALTDMDGDGDSGTAAEGDDLVCSYDFEDPTGAKDHSLVLWHINGTQALGYGTNLMSGGFSAGDTVSCEVTANNGVIDGNTEAAWTVIGNSIPSGSAPSVSSVTIGPDPAYAGDTLTCKYFFIDPDGDPDLSQVAWSVNGSFVGTSWTLSAKQFSAGDTVTCEVTPFDGTYYGQPGSDSIVINP